MPLRARIPHHLIDICDPTESYSAGRFVADASARIVEIHARGRIPLLVGGTFLYLRALFGGLARLPPASVELRRELDERAAREGWPALHAQLRRLDPAGRGAHPCERLAAHPTRPRGVSYDAAQALSELQRAGASAPARYRAAPLGSRSG